MLLAVMVDLSKSIITARSSRFEEVVDDVRVVVAMAVVPSIAPKQSFANSCTVNDRSLPIWYCMIISSLTEASKLVSRDEKRMSQFGI